MGAAVGSASTLMIGWVKRHLWGPLSLLGLTLAVLIFASDRAFKWWMLDVVDIARTQPLRLTPFLSLVLAWNSGVSYGWLEQDTVGGQMLFAVIGAGASLGLWAWLARSKQALTAASLGLIIGGALGNALDRVLYHSVADFFLLHAFGYSWYVFNLADIAIVAGVVLLIYESVGENRQKARI